MSDAGRIIRWSTEYFQLPQELWWPYPAPNRRVHVQSFDIVTFEFETDTGLSGFGFTQTFGRGGAPIQATLQHEIGPLLEGQQLSHPAVHWEELYVLACRLGFGGIAAMALSAADIALWDAHAKLAGAPLYRVLGARRERVAAYGSSIDRAYTDEEFATTLKEYIAAGMTAVKVRVGLPWADDLRRMELMRDTVGPDTRMMVDANSRWTLPEALRWVRHFHDFDLDWLEEPLEWENSAGFAELQAHTAIPIAGGENIYSMGALTRFLRDGAFRVVQPDVNRIGGVTGWMRAAAMASAAGLPVASHLGQDVSVHLLCAAENGTLLEYLPVFDPIVESPLVIAADGTVTPRDVPGHGVYLRRDVIDKYKVS